MQAGWFNDFTSRLSRALKAIWDGYSDFMSEIRR